MEYVWSMYDVVYILPMECLWSAYGVHMGWQEVRMMWRMEYLWSTHEVSSL